MTSNTTKPPKRKRKARQHPFRRAVLRGLGVVLPPLLTVVIFVWIGSTVNQYVLNPLTHGARGVLAWSLSDVRTDLRGDQPQRDGRVYKKLEAGDYVPLGVYDEWRLRTAGAEEVPKTGKQMYSRYVELKFLRPEVVIPFTFSVFILAMYFLGKFLAAGIGRAFYNLFERLIHRLPLVRNVYSSVKQVTDFMFTEPDIEYTRVVAVQYPSKGIWSIGLVTGESMGDIRNAAAEPVVSVLIPSSPMPVTGYTITVLKSETVDLDITIDQAFQFVISCGVVVPQQQLHSLSSATAQKRVADAEALKSTGTVSHDAGEAAASTVSAADSERT